MFKFIAGKSQTPSNRGAESYGSKISELLTSHHYSEFQVDLESRVAEKVIRLFEL